MEWASRGPVIYKPRAPSATKTDAMVAMPKGCNPQRMRASAEYSGLEGQTRTCQLHAHIVWYVAMQWTKQVAAAFRRSHPV